MIKQFGFIYLWGRYYSLDPIGNLISLVERNFEDWLNKLAMQWVSGGHFGRPRYPIINKIYLWLYPFDTRPVSRWWDNLWRVKWRIPYKLWDLGIK